MEDPDAKTEWLELGGEKVLAARDTIRVTGMDPLSKPHDPTEKYLRQLRNLIDAYMNEGRYQKADG